MQAFCVTSDDKNLHGIRYRFLFSKSPVTSNRHINIEKELTVCNQEEEGKDFIREGLPEKSKLAHQNGEQEGALGQRLDDSAAGAAR